MCIEFIVVNTEINSKLESPPTFKGSYQQEASELASFMNCLLKLEICGKLICAPERLRTDYCSNY